MVLGFNHNLKYKGEVFHVQTEDSGVANPHIITLLYRGGVIICSKKTSYSDILRMDNLADVVEELMKEQHKEMMRRLKAGEFDEKAFAIKAQLIENYEIPSPKPESEAVCDVFMDSPSSTPSVNGDIFKLFELPDQSWLQPDLKPSEKSKNDTSFPQNKLDDAILSFFGVHDK